MAVTNTAGIRPNFHRSSQSHTGLNKKLNSTASVKGTNTPLAKYKAAMTTAIDARVNIHDGLAISFGRAGESSETIGSSDYQIFSFQPSTNPMPKHHSATTSGLSRAYCRK